MTPRPLQLRSVVRTSSLNFNKWSSIQFVHEQWETRRVQSCVLYNGMIVIVFTYLFFFSFFVLLRAVSLLFNDPFVDFRCTRWQIIEFSEPCCCFVLTHPLHQGCFFFCTISSRFLFIFPFFFALYPHGFFLFFKFFLHYILTVSFYFSNFFLHYILTVSFYFSNFLALYPHRFFLFFQFFWHYILTVSFYFSNFFDTISSRFLFIFPIFFWHYILTVSSYFSNFLTLYPHGSFYFSNFYCTISSRFLFIFPIFLRNFRLPAEVYFRPYLFWDVTLREFPEYWRPSSSLQNLSQPLFFPYAFPTD